MPRNYILPTMLMTLLLGSGSAMSQDKPPAGEEQKTIAGQQTLTDGTFRLLWSKLNVDFRKVVRGAPYSATAVSEHTQTLSDGNQIIRKTSARYYRDGEGRVRTEQKFDNIGNWTSSDTAPLLIMIGDPVAGRSLTLDPANRTGRVDPYGTPAETKAKPEPAKLANEAKPPVSSAPTRNAAVAAPASIAAVAAPASTAAVGAPASIGVEGAPASAAAVAAPAAPGKEPAGERTRKESLGRQVIDGLEVEGTRTTRTIPAGEIGNTRPIQIVDESWYSPELQLRVVIVHRDPRSGESTFRLTDIHRSEPAGALFEVPPDYRLIRGPETKPVKTVPD